MDALKNILNFMVKQPLQKHIQDPVNHLHKAFLKNGTLSRMFSYEFFQYFLRIATRLQFC